MNHGTNIHDKTIGLAIFHKFEHIIRPCESAKIMIFPKSCALLTIWEYYYRMAIIKNRTERDTRQMAN